MHMWSLTYLIRIFPPHRNQSIELHRKFINWLLYDANENWPYNGLTLSVLISDEGKKINLNFYFHTSLWYFKRFYEGPKGLHKTF